MTTSELSGFYRLDVGERRKRLAAIAELSEGQLEVLAGELGLCDRQADRMVENAVGVLGMPLGICVNMRVNGEDVLVPMAVEEPSVVAASSFAAKLLRAGGGVTTEVAEPHMIGQVQLLEVSDAEAAEGRILAEKKDLLAHANAAHRNLVRAGGGAIDLEVHRLPPREASDPLGPMVVVHVVVDVRDAMGANAINSMCERLAPRLAALSGGRAGLRILSNLTDRRTVRAVGRVSHAALARGSLSGVEVAQRIQEASVFAERDPYRAATHNKGLMNGVDAVLVAFGQDWRAVEAGAHAYAARNGRYTALARWRNTEEALVGEVTLPLAVGTVGGVAKVHPTVQVSRKIARIEDAGKLASIVTAVGLAQNLAALRALAVEGIQSGHMRLHARNVASEAGATGREVGLVANHIADKNTVNIDAAKAVLAELRQKHSTGRSAGGKLDVRERFDALREAHLARIETLIDEVATKAGDQDSSLVRMSRYHMGTGGKRLRALLPLVVAEALGEDPKRLLALGAACEVLHNATLVHDDLQDGDIMRRGQPTVWSKFGMPQAVNLGDAMFYYAILLAQRLEVPAARREAAARRILTETLRVIEGQEAEFKLRAEPVANLSHYFSMVEGKTSGLFALPMVGAAEVLGAAPEVVAGLFETARHLGVLFQIQDDVLDLYGDKGRDQCGSDIREGKRSVLAVHALNHANDRERRWLLSVLDAPRDETSASDVEDVLDLFDRMGSLEFALREIERRARAAVASKGVAEHTELRAMAEGLAELFTKPIAPLFEAGPTRRPQRANADDLAFCDRMLPAVSRTFALSIAALPSDLRTAVCAAYLLCRVVDTVEDEAELPEGQRDRLFDVFDETLLDDARTPEAFETLARSSGLGPTTAERELVCGAGAVFRVFRSLPRPQRESVRPHVHEMSRGMREYVRRADEAGRLRLNDLDDLERYCYYVAGTVGLLLTSLFEQTVDHLPDETRTAARERAVSFGLGLQLVNILKDVAVDFERGDCFLPLSLAKEHGLSLEDVLEPESRQAALGVVRAVAERARAHLDRAAEYTLLWPADEALAVRQFCAVPLALAVASLAEVEHSPDTLRPGRVPKVARQAVKSIFDAVMANAHDNGALRNLVVDCARRPAVATEATGVVHVPRRPPVPTLVPDAGTVSRDDDSEGGPNPMETTESAERSFDGKVLVTGASGHLGANLVRRLLDDGRQVRVLLRHGSNNEAMDGLDVERAFGDLRDYASIVQAADGVETVYHAAANVSTVEGNRVLKREIYDSNVVGTRHLLRAARETNVVRTVVTGSFSATGYHLDDPSRPASEELPVYPFDRKLPYARTKEIVEHECLKAVAGGQDVVVATSCAIIGPHDYKPSRMGRTLLDYARGRLHAYIPGGFEFVAAEDIVQGHVLAMHRGRSGQKYVFSTQYLTLDDIMDLFEEATGRPRPRIKLPPAVMARIADISSFVLSNLFPSAPQRFTPGAVRILRQRRRADLNKAKSELGYVPTGIRKAVHDAYADFALRGLVTAGPTLYVASAGGGRSAPSADGRDKDTAAA